MAFGFKAGIVVGGFAVAMALTNPKEEDHARKLAEDTISPFVEGGRDSPIARIGTAFAESFSDSVVDYHNYLFFSTTTKVGTDERMSIGFLGHVQTTANKTQS